LEGGGGVPGSGEPVPLPGVAMAVDDHGGAATFAVLRIGARPAAGLGERGGATRTMPPEAARSARGGVVARSGSGTGIRIVPHRGGVVGLLMEGSRAELRSTVAARRPRRRCRGGPGAG